MQTLHLPNWVLFCVLGVIYFVFLYIQYKKHSKNSAPESKYVPSSVPSDPPNNEEKYSFNIPKIYNERSLAYHYFDVKIVPVPDGYSHVIPMEPLSLVEHDSSIYVYQRDFCIGEMIENRLAKMVRDWHASGDPVLSYVSFYSDDSSEATIAIAFYLDLLPRFLAKNPEAKLFRFPLDPESFVFELAPGSPCEIEEDETGDKYVIVNDGVVIGRLPLSLLKFAEKNDLLPEDLLMVISSLDYDDEKGKYIVSVYYDK